MNLKAIMRKGVIGVSLIHLFTLSLILVSCSEENTTEDEYANWQERNEAKIDQWDYEVLETGDGKESPLYTDTVRVAYRGRLIPTTSYSDGYVIDQTYLNDFDWNTANMTDYAASNFVNGFTTALMNMHPGDHWRVYIPYQLGYGSSGSTTIKGYSNLTFDIALKTFWHPGEQMEMFKSR